MSCSGTQAPRSFARIRTHILTTRPSEHKSDANRSAIVFHTKQNTVIHSCIVYEISSSSGTHLTGKLNISPEILSCCYGVKLKQLLISLKCNLVGPLMLKWANDTKAALVSFSLAGIWNNPDSYPSVNTCWVVSYPSFLWGKPMQPRWRIPWNVRLFNWSICSTFLSLMKLSLTTINNTFQWLWDTDYKSNNKTRFYHMLTWFKMF